MKSWHEIDVAIDNVKNIRDYFENLENDFKINKDMPEYHFLLNVETDDGFVANIDGHTLTMKDKMQYGNIVKNDENQLDNIVIEHLNFLSVKSTIPFSIKCKMVKEQIRSVVNFKDIIIATTKSNLNYAYVDGKWLEDVNNKKNKAYNEAWAYNLLGMKKNSIDIAVVSLLKKNDELKHKVDFKEINIDIIEKQNKKFFNYSTLKNQLLDAVRKQSVLDVANADKTELFSEV